MEQVAHNEVEAQALQDVTVALRREIASLKAGVHRSPEPSAPIAAVRNYTSSPSGPSLMPSLAKGQFYHMQPEAYTKLTPLSAKDLGPHGNRFFLDGVELVSGLSRQSILSGPDWNPSQPLPFAFADAEQIARAQLRAVVQDERSWEVSAISLYPLMEGLQDPAKWSCSVTLMPRPNSPPASSAGLVNSFSVHMSLSGEVGPVGLRSTE
jgi:hypothetical protein